MGKPQPNEFKVSVALDINGKPIGLKYYDQEGCGWEGGTIGFDMTLRELFGEHEQHRVKSHAMPPRKERCRFYHRPGVEETRCQRNEHPVDEKHKVELSW